MNEQVSNSAYVYPSKPEYVIFSKRISQELKDMFLKEVGFVSVVMEEGKYPQVMISGGKNAAP